MKNVFKILRRVTEYNPQMLLASIVGTATVGSSVGLMMASAYLISAAALHPSIAELGLAIVGVRFFGIFRGVSRYLERLISHKVTFTISAKLRVWFYEAVEPISPAGLFKHKSGDLLKRIASDVESIELVFTKLIAPTFIAVAISIITTFILCFFDTSLAIIAFAGLFAAGFIIPITAMAMGNRLLNQVSEHQGTISNLAVDYVQGMADLQAYGLVNNHKQKLQAEGDTLIHIQHKSGNLMLFTENTVTLIMYTTLFIQMIIVAPLVTAGDLNGVLVACVLLGTMAAFEAVIPLPGAFQFIRQAENAARELLDIIAASIDKPVCSDAGCTLNPGNELAIEFDKVSFSYESGQPMVLDDFSFSLKPGEVAVLKGPSGSGKSTLVSLIFGFWHPQKGIVSVRDGATVCSCNETSIYVNALTQKPYLFAGTIRENMQIAKPEATDEQITDALKVACIDTFINNLPDGLETQVGEHGTTLSGGETRRIAIARTLIADKPFIILDEPIADVDAHTAHKPKMP